MGSYIDKKIGKDENDVGSLKNLVNKEFKNIDKIGYRDDQEILKAGRNVCKNLINEIKNDKTMTYGTRALSPLNNLINDLIKEHNNMKGLKAVTNNKDKINQVANRIDNAENETLRRLKRNNATQKSRNIIEKSKKTNNGNQMFVMEGGSDVKKQTGCLIFTKASNPVRIDQALKGLFDNPDIVYQIDYSKCDTSTKKGRDIKNKMMRLTGTKTCYLRYDKTQKTYTIRDSQGNGICDRAYIWEGVRLIPDGIRKWESYNAEKKANEKLGEDAVYNSDKLAKLTRAMQKDMPSIKNRTPKEQVTLCQKTEIRLNELLKKAKSLGYEIDPECITKKWIGRGHMELHLTSGSSETSRTVIENSDQIGGKDLYSFIGSQEGEYKTYLTRRVKEKRQEFERLTKTEKTNVGKKGKEKLTEKQQIEENNRKNQILYGIGLFDIMIENFRESEGDSWLDNDDKALVEIKNLIRNAKASINDTEIIDNAALKKSFIDPIWFKRASFKRITKTIQDSEGRVTNNPQYQQQYNQLRKIFLGTRNEQIDGIRNLGGHNRIFDKTETSFLQQEIEGNEDLNVKDANIKNCINNIQRRLQNQNIFNEDGSINQKAKEQLDKMFTYARQGTESLIGLLVRSKMLPENRKKEEKKVRKCVENLKNQLNEVNKQSNNINTSLGSLREEQHMEKLRLEQKENKTENDIKRLQALTYLEENPQEQNKINQKTIDQMKIEIKYGNVGQITKGCLFTALVELGGGATGKNSDIYNDIIGYGNRDLSDENAKLAGEIITEIAITVAVAIVTCGVGAVAVGTVLRGAALVARGRRRTRLANYVYKAINVSQKGYKTLKRGGKAAKLGIRSSELLIEGTSFNAASTMIHSAVNGTSLDNLNLNPVAKENIQTAAFLGALSIGNKLGMKVISKLHGQTKIQAFSQAGLKEILKTHKGVFTESLISEATAMIGAEQGMNFMFGHDVINPETGEIETSRSLQRPTQQELIQMIGMIIAFKVVKPGLWAKYEKSLNDGTLEICRSIKENEVLIRNTKTGKIEKIQDLIDGRYNKYKPTPEQYKLRNHNKRLEKQSKYNAEYSEAIEIISKIPEELRTENMKKLLKYKDMIEASPNDIKRIQREIGLKGKDVDGVIGPNFVSKLIDYTKKIKSRSTGGKENTGEHSKGENQELINKKESREKRKEELEKQKKDLETKRQELLKQREANWRSLDLKENGIEKITDILKKGNIITIDGLKYKFNGIKNGKAEFVIEPAAKKSAELGSKRYSEKIEISSLEELLDPRFNLEPGQKRTNSGRYKKLEQLIKDKIEPLDRLKKKIRKKQGEITTLQEEIARLEKGKDTTAHNNYFKENKNKLIGKNVRIDGVKYRAEQLNKDGSIQFKQVDGKDHFVVKSFKELAEKGQVSGFSDGLLADGSTRRGSEELTKSERDNHELIENLIKEEQKYLNSRNIQETINQKKSELQREQEELKLLQEKLPESQARQEKIDERAKKGEEINKELRKIEEEIERNNRELSEAERLTKKYQKELDGKAGAENEKGEGIEEENSKPENVENKLNEEFSRIESGNYENVKLDWMTQKMFETGALIEGVKIRFKNLSLKPNIKIPKEFLKNLRNKLIEMKEKRGDKLSEYHKKLIDKINKLIERKSKENPKEKDVKINQNDIEEIELDIEPLIEEFDNLILGDGITIDGKTYKLEYRINEYRENNQFCWIVDGKTIYSVKAKTKSLPENSDGNRIRRKYYELREKYVESKLKIKKEGTENERGGNIEEEKSKPENDENKVSDRKSESLRETQAQEYQTGQEVYVKRSAGGESRARVEKYNAKTKEYTVRRIEGGETLEKTVKSESLRDISKAEEYLHIMCEEEIDFEKCELTEEEITNIYNNLEKIKEISGKEKFTMRELEKLQFITEDEINTILTMKNEIGEYIESFDVNDYRDAKYIDKEKIKDLLSNPEIKQKLEYITGKSKRTLHEIRSISETKNLNNILDIIKDPIIKQKLEQLKGREISATNLLWLSRTENLETKLDNIIKNIDKLKELTGRNRFNINDIDFYNILTNFTKHDFDKIKATTKQNPIEIIRYLTNNSEHYTKIEFINDKIFKMTRDNGVDYAVINEHGDKKNRFGEITLEDIGNNTYIFHAGMSNKNAAGRAFEDLANAIPEGYKITEILSLSGDSFPLFLSEYQRKFRTDYIVRATGKKIFLNSQGEFTTESQLISKKNVGKNSKIFEAANEADAQEVADAINKLIKDRGQTLVEGQTITELAEAKPIYNEKNGLWRIEIPQIEMIKQHNNGVELTQQLNKCKTYEELTNILLKNLTTEYHFRDGTLTGKELLKRFNAYRDTYINGLDALPKNIDPRKFFPAEFIEPAKWRTSSGTPTWRTTTRKSNIHKILDSK